MLPVWSSMTPQAWVRCRWSHCARHFDPRHRLLTTVTRIAAFFVAFGGPLWMAWLTSDDHIFTWSCWASGGLAATAGMVFLMHDRLCLETGWKRLADHLMQTQGVPLEHLTASPEIPWNLRRHLRAAEKGWTSLWHRPAAGLEKAGEDLLCTGCRGSVWRRALETSGWSPTLMVQIYYSLDEGVAKERLEKFLGSKYPGWSLLKDPHSVGQTN